jgi:hypothetical protein
VALFCFSVPLILTLSPTFFFPLTQVPPVSVIATHPEADHPSLDPVQLTQMAKHLETVYISGWQCSSTASSSLEPGPDLADYPSNTVPAKVAQLFAAQLFHDRKQRWTRLSALRKGERVEGGEVDYLRPMVADADTGHGGKWHPHHRLPYHSSTWLTPQV